MMGLKSLPFHEVADSIIHSFGTLRIEPLGGILLQGF